MNDRISKLRTQTLEARPTISVERARLLTEFYRRPETGGLSAALRHALAFKHVLENKAVCFNDGELIVGERGPAPKATPTYPEVCIHSLQDLATLNDRKKTAFASDDETRRIYAEEIIPFWRGRSQRERIFAAMAPEWISAYEAGIFTEFMEQRAPGHTAGDGKIFHKGMNDFKKDIAAARAGLDFLNDPDAYDKLEELAAMDAVCDGLIAFGRRHADKARELAGREKDAARRRELERIAAVCDRVPAEAPRDFWEALQMYWFVHLGVITEYNTWDSFNPGRLDQHLWPFYQQGLADGSLTKEGARELLQAFWIKFNNQPAPPKVGVTAEESGTYTDFALINVGGLKRDGTDGVNELSYLILDVIEEMRILQPSSMVQISAKGPDAFLLRALKIVKTGFGQPSIFNTDAIVQELVREGKSVADARDGGCSGCVEAGAFGKEAYILTGYFNLPKVFEITLNDGVDPRTGKTIGLKTGDPGSFRTFDELFEAYRRQIRHFVDIKVRGSNVIEKLYAERLPAPFLSVLVDDCIRNGRDYHAGGARYNSNYIQGVGLGTITDVLSAVRWNAYDRRRFTMAELRAALAANFAGHEALRRLVLDRTPKFGNDDDYADDLMKRVFEAYFEAVDGRPTPRGGTYRINLLPTTCHIYFGRMTGATADGRLAGEPVSEGVSPVQGADRKGPTAVIKSLGKLDHVRTGGTLLNQKFTPQLLADEAGLKGLKDLVRSYFRLMGHHIQFNVVTADLLRTAQAHPEKHRDLIVRVAGYSDYFVDCSTELQNEIIRRTEHQEL
ncbi:MAG TPA: glycyl radical protein [Candidatus Aminicenantes bacterium]|nr:glycyl radical protein [Candidatus Aminicenantes bacterium]HRY63894.1 glycyl radical protein [Candidatus Aminicenantes bacterium]HRZ70807.1 glycyl radical protein [Candidatus Aminicenantes bacterium]